MTLSEIKGKRVLLMGLGLQGGGLATANWLTKHGAKLTITDLKTGKQLEDVISQVSGNVVYKLGGHDKRDFAHAEMIVINPDVSASNTFVRYARKMGKPIHNEATLFYSLFKKIIVAVTGTRGKTTVTHWTNHFIASAFDTSTAGNSLKNPFLTVLDKQSDLDMAVTEVPSYHLELFDKYINAPHVAIITNLYVDHLNRHGTISNYASIKAKLLKFQTQEDHVILNKDNKWWRTFSKSSKSANKWLVSSKKLGQNENGIYLNSSWLVVKQGKKTERVLKLGTFITDWGVHNFYNLMQSALAASLVGVSWSKIAKRISTLPSLEFRQETVHEDKKLKIINDTTATTPEGLLAATKRYKSQSTIVILGGTDKKLTYSKDWAKEVKHNIKSVNLVLLEGSATKKMLRALGGGKHKIFEHLDECLEEALVLARKFKKATIVFSPGAKSFEKFENEYDRGRQFNTLVKEFLGK